MALLDPKLDIVFKLLFADPRNARLLAALIEAVLHLPAPIADLEVIDGAVKKETVNERGIVLDVLVRLSDGTRINLEMQCDDRGANPKRWLYGWGRLFGTGIVRGDDFAKLPAVVCIVLLDTRKGAFHERYQVREKSTAAVLSDAFDLHLVHLPVVDASTTDEPLLRWARFFRATESELQCLAEEDPVMAQAKDALEKLSQDDEAYWLAEARLKAKVNWALMQEDARQEGREEGRALHLRSLSDLVLTILRSRKLAFTPEQEMRVRACQDVELLERWVARAATAERIDDLFAGE